LASSHKFLFTEKADLGTSATMIRVNDHVRIGDRIYWISDEPNFPRRFIRTEEKECGWLFYAIEVKDKTALEIIKEKGVFTDLKPSQVSPTIKETKRGLNDA